MKHPIPDSGLDDRLGFVGTAGSGKTYNAGGCVERLLDKGARVVVVDPLDVWWGLRLIADGLSPSRYSMPIFGGPHGDLPLSENAGALIGETVAGMAESCIVSLGGLQTKASERRFMLAFLDAIYRKANGEPVHLVFDEADLWAPQKSSEPMLQSRMEEICRRGRVKGLIPWLITQRPAVISKDVLSQVDGLVAFKLTSSQDRDALEGWIEGQADRAEWKSIRAQLPTMERGQGVIWLPGRGVLETALFPPKRTFDSSRTPKRGEKQRSANLQPLDLGRLKERLAKVEAEKQADDPKKLRAEIARLTTENAKLQRSALPVQQTIDPMAIDVAEQRGFRAGFATAEKQARVALSDRRKFIGDRIAEVVATIDASLGLSLSIPESASPAELAPPRPPIRAQTPRAPAIARSPSPAASGDGSLTNPQRQLLQALAWWQHMGHNQPTRTQVAAIAGWKPKGSNLRNRLTELSTLGLVRYPQAGTVELTERGAAAAPVPDTGKTLIATIREVLTNPQLQLFDALHDFGCEIDRAQLAQRIGWEPGGSNLRNRLTELSQIEVVEYPQRGTVMLQGWVLG